jgi:outer membrane protein assembly factor BamD
MVRNLSIVILMAGIITSCGFHRKKYDNPISKDTQQPDKVLFDRAINDIEHGRYEVARITLNTLINTYDQSEFMAKAKLAVADSWFREGGSAGLAQAEAEYKDFILFYPTMEEAAESQQKICMIHYKQMDKTDRDPNQGLRAEDECRQLIVQFPNSAYVPATQQLLRNIQEALGEGEFQVGTFYFTRGDNQAAAARLKHVVDQYPLYSKADASLWEMGEAYGRLGNRFRKQEGDAYASIVRDYPLSSYADDAKQKLKEMELAVPDADPVALARMKYEEENRKKPGIVSRATDLLKRGPDMSTAARSGNPAMTTLRPSVPVLVPQPAAAAPGFTGDVTATTVSGPSALDTNKDARANPPAGEASAAPAPGAPAADSASATPQAQAAATDPKAKKKKKEKKPKQPDTNATPAAAPAAAPATPAAATPAATQTQPGSSN